MELATFSFVALHAVCLIRLSYLGSPILFSADKVGCMAHCWNWAKQRSPWSKRTFVSLPHFETHLKESLWSEKLSFEKPCVGLPDPWWGLRYSILHWSLPPPGLDPSLFHHPLPCYISPSLFATWCRTYLLWWPQVQIWCQQDSAGLPISTLYLWVIKKHLTLVLWWLAPAQQPMYWS